MKVHVPHKCAQKYAVLFLFVSGLLTEGVTADGAIRTITVSPSFFNATLDEKVTINLNLQKAGSVSASIIDRDGYLIRHLVSAKEVEGREFQMEWDGRTDDGTIVPDEAYSLKIDFVSMGKTDTYFPGNRILKELPVQISYYDRANSILSYRLAEPARVHIQAGVATIDPKTKEVRGPVLKTIANREPRTSGSIVESWTGYDESSTIYVPDLPNFATAVAATSLPENSIITVGNRSRAFVESVSERRGTSLFTFAARGHQHHTGLQTLDDVSPRLVIDSVSGTWEPAHRWWKTERAPVSVQGYLDGPTATNFSRQPGRLLIFLDAEEIMGIPNPKLHFRVEIPFEKILPGLHTIALNWGSNYGPTAVNSFRLYVQESKRQEINKGEE